MYKLMPSAWKPQIQASVVTFGSECLQVLLLGGSLCDRACGTVLV
jgi:hypothetical protein